jgi:hypothetical protein
MAINTFSPSALANTESFEFDCTATSSNQEANLSINMKVHLPNGKGIVKTFLLIKEYQADLVFDMDLGKARCNTLDICFRKVDSSRCLKQKNYSIRFDYFDHIELKYLIPNSSDSISIVCNVFP